MIIYLYVKTHNKTGFKYLGKTSQKDPHKYTGSGIRWINHLKKHGYDFSTEIIKECYNEIEIKEWGLYYSKLWDVVNSSEWANLSPEMGNGGSVSGKNARMYGKRHSSETRKKISKSCKGKIFTDETKKLMSLNHKGMSGKTLSQTAKDKISRIHKGKIISKEVRQKIKDSSPRKKPIQTPLGIFNSIADAAIFLKVHRDTISNRLKKQPLDYYLV